MRSFGVTYHITPGKNESLENKIENICIEQSVEIPKNSISDRIKSRFLGEIARVSQINEHTHQVVINWPFENTGGEIHQLLNILFGNISLKSGIKIVDIEWTALKNLFHGPGFGIEGLREKFNIVDRPLSATAIKPLGSSVEELAEKTYGFAMGGIDIIKDDHNLANQESSPFENRIRQCVEAVKRAADDSGRRSYYFANISGSAKTIYERINLARKIGVDGIMICPHICGLTELGAIARSNTGMPIIAHPAFSGSLFASSNHGIEPSLLIGGLWRALGANMVIFPNVDGRFTFDKSTCQNIANYARSNDKPFKSAFPMPGGGIQRSNVEEWIRLYGADTIFLIGGSLYQHPEGIGQASIELKNKLTGNG